MFMFALTIFLSAFLLFNIQPLMGKYLLPWFGGSSAVWSACILFFQALLLGGYAYAHWLATKRRSTQKRVHLSLLIATLLFLPLSPSFERLSGLVSLSPQLQVLALLLIIIGLPFFTLATNAPLIQHWFGETYPSLSPYRLYALSNIGSLLALLVYPLFMEPFLSLRSQAMLWSGGYVMFIAGCGICLMRLTPRREVSDALAVEEVVGAVTLGRKLLWMILPALASVFLLATTNQLCLEVASVPFLWVLPLSLYLLSFILTFEGERYYCRWFWGLLLALLAPYGWWAFYEGPSLGFTVQLLLFSGLLFTGCMLCHGELYRLRPSPRQLTQYYLSMAAGGALGGLFVTFLAPAIFVTYREYQLALYGVCLVTLATWVNQRAWSISFRKPLFWVSIPLVAYLVTLPFLSFKFMHAAEATSLDRSRNFFGTLMVIQGEDQFGPRRTLVNGHIVHGFQYLEGSRRFLPMSYYGVGSPPEEIFRHYREWRRKGLPVSDDLNVGVVGTGVGTMAAYGQAYDTFRFYEINPLVVEAARKHFNYLENSAAKLELIIGDGRIALEQELLTSGSNNFDILVIDAFTSDSIPIHLLTRESAQLYLHHLRSDGVLLFHITNRFLDLRPVIRGLASEIGCHALIFNAQEDSQLGRSQSHWVAVTRNQPLVKSLAQLPSVEPYHNIEQQTVLFTDDFSSLFRVMK